MKAISDEEKINQLENDISQLKLENTRFLEELDKKKSEKPVMLSKIMEIANNYGLSKSQKQELINNAIKMADEFRKKNKNSK